VSDSKTLEVKILDKDYLVSCPDDKRSLLENAANHLDEKMREIRSSGNIHGVERIAVMAALNITYELLEHNRDSKGDVATLLSIEKKMDKYLSGQNK